MHMRGEPRTMQENPRYADVVDDVRATAFLVLATALLFTAVTTWSLAAGARERDRARFQNAVLSAQDSDRHINSLAPELFVRFPDMNALAKAGIELGRSRAATVKQ